MSMFYRRGHVLLGLLVLSVITVSSCTSIQLISNYDETIDTQAQQLQKKLDTYFISLRNAGGEDLKYKAQQKFYEGVWADLNAMAVRASGIYKNKITIEQIDLAKENLAYLVLMHKQCITGALTKDQKMKVKDKGADLSLDCRVNYGATSDATGRGDIPINRFATAPIQALFNQHLGTIMAFELAKKRGESQSR